MLKCPHFKSLQLYCGKLNGHVYAHTSQLLCGVFFAHSEQKVKKGKEGRDPVDMVKFSKVKSEVKNVHDFVFLCVILIYNSIVCCTVAQIYFSFVTCLSRQSPIQESLIDFSDSGMNRVAADIFLGERRVRQGAMDTDRR